MSSGYPIPSLGEIVARFRGNLKSLRLPLKRATALGYGTYFCGVYELAIDIPS